jgi:type IV secretory pathway VirB2 component (pilin)
MAYPKNAGIIMIIAAILGWIFGKGPFGWPGAVLLIGGIFALSGQGELKS